MFQIASSTSLLKVTLALVLIITLASCGFKPVYGKTDTDTVSKLASVRVEKVPNRDGQVLQYKLEDLLTPSGTAGIAEYSIIIKLNTERAELGIQGDLRVTRYDIVKTAEYQLVKLDTNTIVDKGRVRIKSSFNRTTSEFSTFVAEEDANEKASEELAQEIRSRLIYYFSK